MSTINEIVFKIKERHSSFFVTDDYKISDELIISMMNDIRETLIREDKNRNGFITGDYYQMNCCSEIECVTETCTYNGEEISAGSTYQMKLNGLVKGVGDSSVKYVGNLSATSSFHIMSNNMYFASEGRMWVTGKPSATIIGDTMYFKDLPTEGMKFVCISALLRDPRTSCDWRTDDSDYPVPSETKLVDMVLYRIMTSSRVPNDKINNAADDTTQPKIADGVTAELQRLTTAGNRNNQR